METIKEEKKADLEQLLNSLIEKGWKPFGRRPEWIKKAEQYVGTFNWVHWWLDYQKRATIRELVSKESWLWQFVCENRMEKKMERNHRWIWINSRAKSAYQSYPVYTMERYEYRVIESSLKDDSELEDFLLSNIKVDGTTK